MVRSQPVIHTPLRATLTEVFCEAKQRKISDANVANARVLSSPSSFKSCQFTWLKRADRQWYQEGKQPAPSQNNLKERKTKSTKTHVANKQ